MNQCTKCITFIRPFLFKFVMAISKIGMQTHVYVCIFLIWTSNHATIILRVDVRFTFKWNVDCMDGILMMWNDQVRRLPAPCVLGIYIHIYKKKIGSLQHWWGKWTATGSNEVRVQEFLHQPLNFAFLIMWIPVRPNTNWGLVWQQRYVMILWPFWRESGWLFKK